jgi:hypothetical protein
MARTPQPVKVAPLYLDDRIPGGYVFVCSRRDEEHSFLLRKLGPSIECPNCGRTALSASLLNAYYERIDQTNTTTLRAIAAE